MTTEYRIWARLVSGVTTHGQWHTDKELVLQWVEQSAKCSTVIDTGYETRITGGN